MLDFPSNSDVQTNRPQLRLVTEKAAISVASLGCRSAVSSDALSQLGHRVVPVDIDLDALTDMSVGLMSAFGAYPATEQIRKTAPRWASAASNLMLAVADTDVTFVSIKSPPLDGLRFDNPFLEATAHAIGLGMRGKTDFSVIVFKGAVEAGVMMDVVAKTLETVSGLKLGVDFGLCIDRELQREAMTIEQYFDLPQNILGVSDARTARIMTKIYTEADGDMMVTSLCAAEMGALTGTLTHAMELSHETHLETGLDFQMYTGDAESDVAEALPYVQNCAIKRDFGSADFLPCQSFSAHTMVPSGFGVTSFGDSDG